VNHVWNWPEGKRAFKRAIELDPSSAPAHYRYATEYLFSVGRYDEAIAKVKRALELEPLDLNMVANLARAYLYAGQPDKALEQAKKAHDLESNSVIGRFTLGMAYNRSGAIPRSIAHRPAISGVDQAHAISVMSEQRTLAGRFIIHK
jgi:tetratricopeptide (TPR) repeat protein